MNLQHWKVTVTEVAWREFSLLESWIRIIPSVNHSTLHLAEDTRQRAHIPFRTLIISLSGRDGTEQKQQQDWYSHPMFHVSQVVQFGVCRCKTLESEGPERCVELKFEIQDLERYKVRRRRLFFQWYLSVFFFFFDLARLSFYFSGINYIFILSSFSWNAYIIAFLTWDTKEKKIEVVVLNLNTRIQMSSGCLTLPEGRAPSPISPCFTVALTPSVFRISGCELSNIFIHLEISSGWYK